MKKILFMLSGLILLQTSPSLYASDLGINVILSGEVRPGVYGQVEIGNARPQVVYERPRVIVSDRRYIRDEPIYLHVPPGHAKHWDKHCRKYNACGRSVYFVRSQEYEPNYYREDRVYREDRQSDDEHEEDDRHKGRGHGHGHGHKDK